MVMAQRVLFDKLHIFDLLFCVIFAKVEPTRTHNKRRFFTWDVGYLRVKPSASDAPAALIYGLRCCFLLW